MIFSKLLENQPEKTSSPELLTYVSLSDAIRKRVAKASFPSEFHQRDVHKEGDNMSIETIEQILNQVLTNGTRLEEISDRLTELASKLDGELKDQTPEEQTSEVESQTSEVESQTSEVESFSTDLTDVDQNDVEQNNIEQINLNFCFLKALSQHDYSR